MEATQQTLQQELQRQTQESAALRQQLAAGQVDPRAHAAQPNGEPTAPGTSTDDRGITNFANKFTPEPFNGEEAQWPVDAPGAIPEQPVAVPVDAPVAAAAPKVKAGFGRGRKRANTPVKKGTITGLKTSLAKRVEWGRKIREVRKPERKRIIAEASAATGKSVNAIRMWLLKLNIYGFAKSAQGSK